ncbi:hypothetical protein UO65_4620 [Actinokineospora spheciospongiae]|uniref:Uncharacterized protein n=1 Tax=Actinokineospora spheciospongiae TaxID=909613 RepID=W7J1U1_9PSEU|nr:hypothetical protein [Actinokineospora spheciospongiae]EWC60054.1 hypothetical protein UO65_4620 [Actinokineospora spheciospongiae]
MTSYADVRSWNADALEGVAQAVRGRKEQILGLQDELDMSFGPLFWHGENATNARGALSGLRDRAEHIVAEAAHVQKALQDAADAVDDLRRQVEELETTARANRFTIGPDGSIRDDDPSTDPDRPRTAQLLAEGVGRVLGIAGEVDSRLVAALTAAAGGNVDDHGATTLADADVTTTADGKYHTGPPEKPTFTFDEDFAYDSADSELSDHLAKAKWLAQLRGAQALGLMPDATEMYEHYWDNTGAPKEWDYEKAYREDSGIRQGVDSEVTRAARAAEELIRSGRTDFSMTGAPTGAEPYPKTENWQKAVGGYQIWSHGNVKVEGNRVTMVVTVEGQDRYNFNRGQSDIATGASDNGNGRFTEIGWAKPFDTHGSMTKTITWELGHPPTGLTDDPAPDDGTVRGTDRDRGPTPDNPREPGRNRAR